jgi:RNA polymerase sigma-70 factor (ECF subfamily)
MEIRDWMLGHGIGCRGSRLVPTAANGSPAFAQYRPSETTEGRWEPWALQVVEISGGRIVHMHAFLDTPRFLDAPRLFRRFGLPPYLER